MPKFTYQGDRDRVYPSLPAPANDPIPGATYDLKADPGDGRWVADDGGTDPTDPPKTPAKKAAAKKATAASKE